MLALKYPPWNTRFSLLVCSEDMDFWEDLSRQVLRCPSNEQDTSCVREDAWGRKEPLTELSLAPSTLTAFWKPEQPGSIENVDGGDFNCNSSTPLMNCDLS